MVLSSALVARRKDASVRGPPACVSRLTQHALDMLEATRSICSDMLINVAGRAHKFLSYVVVTSCHDHHHQ